MKAKVEETEEIIDVGDDSYIPGPIQEINCEQYTYKIARAALLRIDDELAEQLKGHKHENTICD